MRWLVLSYTLFSASLLLGIFLHAAYGISVVEELRQLLGELGGLDLFIFLLVNNGVRTFFAVLLGFFFGIVPLIFAVANGLVLGLVACEVAIKKGVVLTLAAILPHGVIEIPALLLTISLGLSLGHEFVKKLRGAESDLKGSLAKNMGLYFKLVLPMLVVAAFVEAFITPVVIGLVCG